MTKGIVRHNKKRVLPSKKAASFPEGELYELLLMEIVEKNNAHIPLEGRISKYWTKVVPNFNATTGPNVDKMNDWRPIQRKYVGNRSSAAIFSKLLPRGQQTKEASAKQ